MFKKGEKSTDAYLSETNTKVGWGGRPQSNLLWVAKFSYLSSR